MNLGTNLYTGQPAYTSSSGAPSNNHSPNLAPSPSGPYGTSSNVALRPASATPPQHTAMYTTAASPSSAGTAAGSYQTPGQLGAVRTTATPPTTATTYSAYTSNTPPQAGSTAAAAARSGGFIYTGALPPRMQQASAPSLYPANSAATATLFQMGGPTALTQAPAGPQMMAAAPHPPQPQPQPQPAAFNAAMAAYNNPVTNINMGYKLFVGQVPAVCTEEQLRPLFGAFGSLLEVKIMREPNGRSRGSAWVRYETEDAARRAIAALNERHVVPPQTNALRVQFATPSVNRTAMGTPGQQQMPMQQPAPLQAPVAAAAQMQAPAARAYSTFITTSPHQQPQQMPPQQQQQQQPQKQGGGGYAAAATTTYGAAPQGYAPQPNAPPAPTAAYISQGQYTASNMIAYGNNDSGFAMRAPGSHSGAPSQHHQQQQQPQPPQFAGNVEYLQAGQQGGSVLYTTVSPAGAGAMASLQRQQVPQQQQQQHHHQQPQQVPPPQHHPHHSQQQQQQAQQQQQQQQVLYTTGGPMRTSVVYAPEGFTMSSPMSTPSQQQQQQQQWRQ